MEAFDWVDASRLSSNRKSVIEAIMCSTLWMIWCYRNDVVHEVRLLRKEILFDAIREFLFLWFSDRHKKISVNWTVLLQDPLNV